MANRSAVEQQHRNLQAKAARELGIRVHVDHGDGGNGLRSLEFGERMQHVMAKSAALAAQHHEAGGQLAHLLRGWAGARLMPPVDEAFEAFTCVAMNCTVFGGTSPMAVTW